MEWDGQTGLIRYYDKERKENVNVGEKLTFILLDQLGCVKGWHDASESGIFSNEVKDTRRDPLVVKAFKANGVLAHGIYAQIRDRINAIGGKFHTNLYLAFKDGDGQMRIGSLMLKGAALREWTEFTKAHRADIYKKAIAIVGSKEGKKGKVVFKAPLFAVKDITPETDEAATELDRQLQVYLKAYLSRPTNERLEEQKQEPADEPEEQQAPFNDEPADDDIPF